MNKNTFKSIRCRSSRPGYVQRPTYISTSESIPCKIISEKEKEAMEVNSSKTHVTITILKNESVLCNTERNQSKVGGFSGSKISLF